MKKAVLLTVLVLGAAGISDAAVVGEWIKTTSGSDDIFTLQITDNTEGADIVSFDLLVTGSGFVVDDLLDSTWRNQNVVNIIGEYSSLLPPSSHVVALNLAADSTTLSGSATLQQGYRNEWGMTPALAQIVVATGSITDPLSELSISGTATAAPLVQVLGSDTTTDLQVVPEPATMTALGLGGLTLLRRRRRNRK